MGTTVDFLTLYRSFCAPCQPVPLGIDVFEDVSSSFVFHHISFVVGVFIVEFEFCPSGNMWRQVIFYLWCDDNPIICVYWEVKFDRGHVFCGGLEQA